ncbi:integrase core domain protein [Lasius niger]|uniref:RNA-directed DNA polymerase n=1 Tax=Lasius niger TaxID=67767 RepID=A0A0J7KP19_LASNI|nr:integrase core domain protein [Lasius niger]
MSACERNYSQTDKEALAILVGVKKLHNYLYGRPFEIRTDHRPLLEILGREQKTPDVLSPRMLRWSIVFSAYNYHLIYVSGKDIGNADGLSRLPLPTADITVPHMEEVLMLESAPEPLLDVRMKKETKKDPVLSRLLHYLWFGWPQTVPDDLKQFQKLKAELSVYRNCILLGSRVVIPSEGRKTILETLHSTHPGVVKMKVLAKSYVWWPGITKDIEKFVARCEPCQEVARNPPRENVHPWEYTKDPWSRIHIDHAGPIEGQLFLIVVDSYSKYLEVRPVASTAAEQTIKRNLIRHVKIAPYHPASNGQAKRMVQTTKQALMKQRGGDWSTKIARFLLRQHTTPSATAGVSPAELLMGRKLKTCLNKLHPDRRPGKLEENTSPSDRLKKINQSSLEIIPIMDQSGFQQ